MLDEIKAQELIAQGEGQHVELKREVPSKVRELSEEVCALANATGGYILLGVDNDGKFTEGFTINNRSAPLCGIPWTKSNPRLIATSTRLTYLAMKFG
jgi:ATP-dependent DNA helicase RecG